MTSKNKTITLILLVLVLASIPGTAFASFDEYGYNAEGRMFKGTLDNWESFLDGAPATSWDPKAANIVFLERKWDKNFDPMVSGEPPVAPGAWQKAELWEYLSGDQLGWTWNLELEIVYSPYNPIPEAFEIPVKDIGFAGFYLVYSQEWLSGPKEEKVIIQEFSVKRNIISQALKLKNR